MTTLKNTLLLMAHSIINFHVATIYPVWYKDPWMDGRAV